MSTLETWHAVSEAKHGAAELLARAALVLQGPGASIGEIREALSDATAARLALIGCENAVEKLMQRQLAVVDAQMMRAEGGAR